MIFKIIKLSVLLCLFSSVAQAEHLPLGSDVLANCHGFFSKGKIKRLYKEQYVVNFYKESRPVLCTPFAWTSMFLVPYKPVEKYTARLSKKSGFFSSSEDAEVQPGDRLKVFFKATERGKLFSNKYTVIVVVKEINENGAALLVPVKGEVKAKQVFQRWVGSNYVDLDFSKALVADRLTILDVENE
jgi:hypothetical protein